MEKQLTPDNLATSDPIVEFGRLLAEAGARPRINRKRLAPSTLHDATYHIAIIACAFATHGEQMTDGTIRILASWLKMLQFVAARPQLVSDLHDYVKSRNGTNLLAWTKMPRGYLGDRAHDATICFLVATALLTRNGKYIQSGKRFAELGRIAAHIDKEGLFWGERRVLKETRTIKVTSAMLEGQ